MLVESCSELACELEAVFSAFDESGVERLSQALAKDGYSVPSPAGGGFATATQHAIRTTLDLMLSIDPPPLAVAFWTAKLFAISVLDMDIKLAGFEIKLHLSNRPGRP